MEEAIIGAYDELAPDHLSGLSWIPETHILYYMAEEGKEKVMVLHEPISGDQDTLRVKVLNDALAVFNGIMNRGIPLPNFESFPSVHSWKSSHEFRFKRKNLIYLYDLDNHRLMVEHQLPDDHKLANLEVHAATGNLAYTIDNNLWVKETGKAAFAVSSDSNSGIVYGQSVHRNEFGISKGIFWSNDGKKLAFYRMDETMVTEYPIYQLEKMPAQARTIRYPFAGAKSHQVTVGIHTLNYHKTHYLQTGKPFEQYLTNIAWGPKDDYVFIAALNREQNFMSLRRYKAEDGAYDKTLFTESHEKYVEPEHPMHWVDGKTFIWQSERNGFNHLYLYESDGEFVRQLTNGAWIVTELLGTDSKGRYAYFMGTKRSPLDRNLYRVRLKSGEIEAIIDNEGYHRVEASSDYELFIDEYSTPTIPGITRVVKEDGKTAKQLLKSKDPLKNYKLGNTEIGTIKADDGQTDLYYRMIKPVDFDSTKKYPVVVYVYGGPHLQLIDNRWLGRANLWMHYMAQRGYIMFTIDSRGTDNRGLEFENSTFRQLGTVEIADQLKGVEFLKSKSYVDAEKMAVHGWSFGGFMTTSLLTRAPGVFKVGVAGGPVIDWSMYEIMYTERYMDTPEDNPEGYANNNLLKRVGDLQDDLLMIHGSSDDVVLWQHSLLFIQECVKQGIPIDYFVYPGHPHNVRGKDRVHLMNKVSDYIEEKLNN